MAGKLLRYSTSESGPFKGLARPLESHLKELDGLVRKLLLTVKSRSDLFILILSGLEGSLSII